MSEVTIPPVDPNVAVLADADTERRARVLRQVIAQGGEAVPSQHDLIQVFGVDVTRSGWAVLARWRNRGD